MFMNIYFRVKVIIPGQMEGDMKVIGRMENNMERLNTTPWMDYIKWGCGITVNV